MNTNKYGVTAKDVAGFYFEDLIVAEGYIRDELVRGFGETHIRKDGTLAVGRVAIRKADGTPAENLVSAYRANMFGGRF